MKKITRFVGAFLSVMLISSSSFAGLSETLTQSGPKAVGKEVASAATEILASEDTDAQKQAALSALLDEAAATGDNDAVRYAVIAVMQAAGSDNSALSKAAISESTVSSKFAAIVDRAVDYVEKLAGAGSAGGASYYGNGGAAGGGDGLDSGEASGGALATDDLVSGDINDNDAEATDT